MSTCSLASRRGRAWPADVPSAARAPVGEVEQRPALAIVESAAAAPPLATWEPEVLAEACDPSPRAAPCALDADPVFARPWRPKAVSGERWTAMHDARALTLLGLELERLHGVVAGRTTPRPVRLVSYPGRPGWGEDYPVLGDVGELAGGRTGEDSINFDPLETS